MRIKHDPRKTKTAVYVLLTGTALMIIWKLLSGTEDLWESFGSFLNFLWRAILPVVTGLVIAYILSPAAEWIETFLTKIFKKEKAKKHCRGASLAIVYILLLGLIVLFISFIAPGLGANITELVDNLPDYWRIVEKWYNEEAVNSVLIDNIYTQKALDNINTVINERLNQWVVDGVAGVASFTYNLITGIFSFILSLILSFYFLAGRKKLKEEVLELTKATLGSKRTAAVRAFIRQVDWVFGKYISAKLVQLLLVFMLSEIAFILLKVPYTTLMAFVLSVFNIVPFIGPIIGLIPVVLITLLFNPVQALWVLITILAIQALDAYLIQPTLIGDKMGLPPFWILVVVILGGAFFGVWGIILSIPVAAVIRLMLHQFVRRRKRKMEITRLQPDE